MSGTSVPGAAARESEFEPAVCICHGARHGGPEFGAANMDACPGVKHTGSGLKHSRLSVVKFLPLRQQLRSIVVRLKPPMQVRNNVVVSQKRLKTVLSRSLWENIGIAAF